MTLDIGACALVIQTAYDLTAHLLKIHICSDEIFHMHKQLQIILFQFVHNYFQHYSGFLMHMLQVTLFVKDMLLVHVGWDLPVLWYGLMDQSIVKMVNLLR